MPRKPAAPRVASEETVQMHLTLPKSLRDQLAAVALRDDMPMYEIMRRAIAAEVDRLTGKP